MSEEQLKIQLQYVDRAIQELKENQTTINERIDNINQQQAISDERFRHILACLDALKKEVNMLAEKPAKRWETILAGIISSSVGILVGMFLGK